jgi:hypothetical protein
LEKRKKEAADTLEERNKRIGEKNDALRTRRREEREETLRLRRERFQQAGKESEENKKPGKVRRPCIREIEEEAKRIRKREEDPKLWADLQACAALMGDLRKAEERTKEEFKRYGDRSRTSAWR